MREGLCTIARDTSSTIRSRAFGGNEFRLSALLALVAAQNKYTVIKCCFCRELKPAAFHPNLDADRA